MPTLFLSKHRTPTFSIYQRFKKYQKHNIRENRSQSINNRILAIDVIFVETRDSIY